MAVSQSHIAQPLASVADTTIEVIFGISLSAAAIRTRSAAIVAIVVARTIITVERLALRESHIAKPLAGITNATVEVVFGKNISTTAVGVGGAAIIAIVIA